MKFLFQMIHYAAQFPLLSVFVPFSHVVFVFRITTMDLPFFRSIPSKLHPELTIDGSPKSSNSSFHWIIRYFSSSSFHLSPPLLSILRPHFYYHPYPPCCIATVAADPWVQSSSPAP